MSRLIILLGLLLAACKAPAPAAPDLPPPPPHLHGQALWRIVHDQCVPDEQAHGAPAPCAEVVLDGGVANGVAVLKDLHGVAQYLVMPTEDITGIEDARLLSPTSRNYFADAWRARRLVEAKLGKPLPDADVGVSVNSLYGRSQDLLHLHVDCLSPQTFAALKADARSIGPRWSRAPLILDGHPYYAIRLEGAAPPDAFQVLAQGIRGAARSMGAWTLVLAEQDGADGRPGFVLLANRADPLRGDFASGEELQDHDCAIVDAGASATTLDPKLWPVPAQ
jgi:CDP-diacylglycerol pyrophosphatase